MPYRELDRAETQLHIMQSATNLDVYEEAWKCFLTDIETAWNLCLDAVKGNGRAQQIVSSTNRDRKIDDLVRYLKHARNSRTHSIRPITERILGVTTVMGGTNGGVILQGTIAGRDPTATRLETSGTVIVSFQPDRLEVIEVQDRGHSYLPPTWHQGSPVSTCIPHVLAAMGLTYYRSAVSAALSA